MREQLKYKILQAKLISTYLISKTENIKQNKNKKRVIVALAADYGNLGDVAITYAQKKFLETVFPNREIVLFPISKTFSQMKTLKKIVCKDDIITIVGGGNMGNLYQDIEFCRQFVIRNFKSNKIVLFPQTIDYEDNDNGYKMLHNATKLYGKHKNLSIFVREEITYKKYKDIFKNPLYLVPDIVMGFKPEIKNNTSRKGAILCLRNDKERAISKENQKTIETIISSTYSTKYDDTQIKYAPRDLKELKHKLYELLERISSSEIVVTDRLHGMIFCYITDTPCIVLSGSNHKIRGCYEWIKNVPFIRLIDVNNLNDLSKIIVDVCNSTNGNLKKISYSNSYKKLEEVLNSK